MAADIPRSGSTELVIGALPLVHCNTTQHLNQRVEALKKKLKRNEEDCFKQDQALNTQQKQTHEIGQTMMQVLTQQAMTMAKMNLGAQTLKLCNPAKLTKTFQPDP